MTFDNALKSECDKEEGHTLLVTLVGGQQIEVNQRQITSAFIIGHACPTPGEPKEKNAREDNKGNVIVINMANVAAVEILP